MKEPTVTADNGRAPRVTQAAGRGAAGVRRNRPAGAPAPVTAATLLERLEKRIDSELGPLRAGVEPLLGQVRQALAALYPGADGTLLSPKEQQARREKLEQTLDELEEILEALQLAARTRRGA
jgi:hypothetical protein